MVLWTTQNAIRFLLYVATLSSDNDVSTHILLNWITRNGKRFSHWILLVFSFTRSNVHFIHFVGFVSLFVSVRFQLTLRFLPNHFVSFQYMFRSAVCLCHTHTRYSMCMRHPDRKQCAYLIFVRSPHLFSQFSVVRFFFLLFFIIKLHTSVDGKYAAFASNVAIECRQ